MDEHPSEPDRASDRSSSKDATGPQGLADEASPSLEGGSSTFYLNMARLWVQEHQKASMLGAFAVGVFVGALFRN